MNAQLSVSSTAISPDHTVGPHFSQKQRAHAPFRKVTDLRGAAIRGLWKRNGRFYAQLRIRGKRNAVKVPLLDQSGNPVRTPAQARAALNDLLTKRRTNSLPSLNRTPTLSEYIERYLRWLRRTQIKSPLTIAKEAGALTKWNERLGFIRLAHIQRAHINEFLAWRKETNLVSNRTINLDVIALNNCLGHARDEGLIVSLPTQNWTPLEHQSPRRPLWTAEQIEKVCGAAISECANGRLLADYIRFLACTGMRRNEALRIKWGDVDWKNRRLTIRVTKYRVMRDLDLNATTETLLRELQLRGTPNGQWLFPSPRAAGDQPARSLQASLEVARCAAGLPDFCFHDLRHYFISTCVMAGIDYLTIARWVGHRDGGVLIGRVYGHLNDEHAKKMATRLVFGERVP